MFNDCKTVYYISSSTSFLKSEIRHIVPCKRQNDFFCNLWIVDIVMS